MEQFEAGRRNLAAKAFALTKERQRIFGSLDELFRQPAWDMLIDLMRCEGSRRAVSVSDACIASKVPPTTALRWIRRLERAHLVHRVPDPSDGRRCFVRLTQKGKELLGRYLDALD